MRRMIMCAAAVAISVVALDQVVASGNAAYESRDWTIERGVKSDRLLSTARMHAPAPPALRPAAQTPSARPMPDGCEAPYSPLSRAAKDPSSTASAALCIS